METPRKTLRNKHLLNVSKISTPLKLPPSPMLKHLGFGTGINVYCLERSPRFGKQRSPWAIKRISRTARQNSQMNDFRLRLRGEAEILRKLNHPNIVGYRGFKADDGVESLALEHCQISLGTILEDRLEEDKGPLEANLILKMCSDIIKALSYLHNEAHILHGDVKSYNILVKGNFEICKLCDFGVSLPLNENGLIDFKSNSDLEYVGTQLWSAPEVIDGEDIICDKADIFSFGLVVYETIALIPPHTWNDNNKADDDDDVDECEEDLLSYQEKIKESVGTRPPLPQSSSLPKEYNQVIEIFYICTAELPEDRPSAKVLCEALSQ